MEADSACGTRGSKGMTSGVHEAKDARVGVSQT